MHEFCLNTCIQYNGKKFKHSTMNADHVSRYTDDNIQLTALLCYRLPKKHRLFLQLEGLHLLTEDKWQSKEKEN